jgi:hypothetical protein
MVLIPVNKRIYSANTIHVYWRDKIPKNNDEGRAIYRNLENKINRHYWPVKWDHTLLSHVTGC